MHDTRVRHNGNQWVCVLFRAIFDIQQSAEDVFFGWILKGMVLDVVVGGEFECGKF